MQVPVESPVLVAAEATDTNVPDASPSPTDLKLNGNQRVPEEQARPGRQPGAPSSSSSLVDIEEVEDIVPTSDPMEAAEEENEYPIPPSHSPLAEDEYANAQLVAAHESSQEVPHPDE